MSEPGKPRAVFVLKVLIDEDELVGARWWNDAFVQAATGTSTRRVLITTLVVSGAVAAVFMGIRAANTDDDDGIDYDSLVLQRQQGWDVGSPDVQLVFSSPVQMDAATNPGWNRGLETLAAALAPSDTRLAPFAAPTLFLSLLGPANARLRRELYPVFSDEMRAAFERGAALADLAAAPGAPRDVALVLDLPGPQSVALAAAVSGAFAPVFVFDNWPHPRGVVPAHQTLGAAVYYRPTFEAANLVRPVNAPPVFVLDAARLSPYRDEPTVFDNRSVVNLPSAEQLRGLGIRRVLYVRPSGGALEELDDLNADFVALERGGVDVRAIGLDDFDRTTEATAVSSMPERHYYYGGHPSAHLWFWSYHGWAPAPAFRPGLARPTLPSRIAARPQYHPTPRPTIFNSRAVGGVAGLGKQKPSGFGRVSFRSGGGPSTRSGSFGRSRSSYSS